MFAISDIDLDIATPTQRPRKRISGLSRHTVYAWSRASPGSGLGTRDDPAGDDATCAPRPHRSRTLGTLDEDGG